MQESLKYAAVQWVLYSHIVCKSEEVSFPFAERDLQWPIPADFISSQVTTLQLLFCLQAALHHT